MPVVLPALSLFFIMLCFIAFGTSYRKALLLAAIACGLLLTAATEILSLFTFINHFSISIYWVGITIVAMISFIYKKNNIEIKKPKFDNILLIAGVGTIVIMTLLIAIVSPPNNWDSMTYHMSRVMHWIQNESVSHYPTNITRQLYSSPWAEYAIMHLQILSGGDYFANLVQWLSMCGSIIGISLIAKEFGASGYIQTFAAAFVATIPMGILQASSTQNDYVVSFWLVCFVYFGLLLVRDPIWKNVLAVGCSLALAILTKGTAYIFALPFFTWFLYSGIKAHGAQLLNRFIVISIIVISLNSGHFIRNYSVWGNPITTADDRLTNEYFDVKGFVSNLSRNIVSHTWTHLESINLLQYRGVVHLHRLIGLDISDPATSLNEMEFHPARISFHEDYAGNGLHLLLIFSAILVIIIFRGRLYSPTALFYTISAVGGLLLFSILLKWQPWGSRLQLPFFILASPLVAVGMRLLNRKLFLNIVMTVLLLCSIPWVFRNDSRPLVGEWSILTTDREKLYFVNQLQMDYYLSAVNEFKIMGSCRNVGLIGSGDAYEYPFWVLVRKRVEQMPRIEHINVNNISGKIPFNDFTPCAAFRLL